MADISKELQEILSAVYGEDVRGSIHDAIALINAVGEKNITLGTDVTAESSPATDYYKGSVYINTDTYDLWVFDGTIWVNKGNIKGEAGEDGQDGADGADGNKIFRGSVVNGKSVAPAQFTLAFKVNENDNYINISEGAMYHCTSGADASEPSLWSYDFTMTGGGGGGGVTDYADLNGLPQIEGKTLVSGNNTASSLGLAKADDVKDFYKKPTGGIPADDLATAVKDKLTKIPSTNGTKDQVLLSNGDGTSSWGDAPSGGHEMIDEVADVLSAEKSEKKVVNAFTMADFSNVYTECLVATLVSGNNTIGTWFEEGQTWDTSKMWVESSFIEHSGEQLHFEFDFWVGAELNLDASHVLHANSTPLHLAGYQWDSVTGALTIKCGETAPNDISVVVKITHIRERS